MVRTSWGPELSRQRATGRAAAAEKKRKEKRRHRGLAIATFPFWPSPRPHAARPQRPRGQLRPASGRSGAAGCRRAWTLCWGRGAAPGDLRHPRAAGTAQHTSAWVGSRALAHAVRSLAVWGSEGATRCKRSRGKAPQNRRADCGGGGKRVL